MPTKIITPSSTVGTGISVNVVNVSPIKIREVSCPNTNIMQDRANILLQTLSVLISSQYPPQTIVNYVCAEVNVTSISSNNWCFLNCVSANIFKNQTFVTPNTYTYSPNTFALVTNCFPQYLLSSSGDGGEATSMHRPDLENIIAWRIKQINDLLNALSFASDDILNALNDMFTNMGNVTASFATRIAMAVEHLAEILSADMTKKIGAAITWIAKAWKTIRDMFNAVSNYSKVRGEAKTDSGAGTLQHLSKALQDSLTTIDGFLTDVLKDAGQYTEEIGELLYDMADRLIDLKEIAFMFRTLSAMISEFTFTISWSFQRMIQSIKAETYAASQVGSIYDKQSEFSNELQTAKTLLAGALSLQHDYYGLLHEAAMAKAQILAIPGEIKDTFTSTVASEKAAYSKLQKANTAYTTYIKNDIGNVVNKIKALSSPVPTGKVNFSQLGTKKKIPMYGSIGVSIT